MTNNMLSLGSVVYLKSGKIPVMIVSRQPILNLKTGVCYFDYGGVNQLTGLVSNQAVYFNQEDISTIVFEGYISENEERFQEAMEEWATNTDIKKGNTKD